MMIPYFVATVKKLLMAIGGLSINGQKFSIGGHWNRWCLGVGHSKVSCKMPSKKIQAYFLSWWQ